MLNKRQREFRKAMKEIEKTKGNQKAVYSYQDQRFANERKRRFVKRPLLQVGGMVSLLVLLWNLYAVSTYLFPGDGSNRFLSAKQLEVHRYVQQSSEIELALSASVNSLINRYNEKSLTPFHIEEAQREIFELQKKAETKDSRFLAMKATLDDQFNMAYQVTNVLKLGISSSVHQELTSILNRKNEAQNRQREMLMRLLDNEGMRYKQLEDGRISYEYEIR